MAKLFILNLMKRYNVDFSKGEIQEFFIIMKNGENFYDKDASLRLNSSIEEFNPREALFGKLFEVRASIYKHIAPNEDVNLFIENEEINDHGRTLLLVLHDDIPLLQKKEGNFDYLGNEDYLINISGSFRRITILEGGDIKRTFRYGLKGNQHFLLSKEGVELYDNSTKPVFEIGDRYELL